MLPQQNRLRSSRAIEELFRSRKSVHSPMFTVRWAERRAQSRRAEGEQGRPRFAFVAGLKVSKKATERNKIKRLAREAVRALIPSVKEGVDVAIVARPGAAGASFEDIKKDLIGLLKRARILV